MAGEALCWTRSDARARGFDFRPRAHAARTPLAGFALHEGFLFHAEGVQTNRDERFIFAYEDVLGLRLLGRAQAKERSAGFSR